MIMEQIIKTKKSVLLERRKDVLHLSSMSLKTILSLLSLRLTLILLRSLFLEELRTCSLFRLIVSIPSTTMKTLSLEILLDLERHLLSLYLSLNV